MTEQKEVVWVDPQTNKKWYRRGKCLHCGGCCTTRCPHLFFIALRDIKKGEKFYGIGENKGNLIAKCDIFNTDIEVNTPPCVICTATSRRNYPSTPLITCPTCGYYWVDEEGNRWEKQKHNHRLGKTK